MLPNFCRKAECRSQILTFLSRRHNGCRWCLCSALPPNSSGRVAAEACCGRRRWNVCGHFSAKRPWPARCPASWSPYRGVSSAPERRNRTRRWGCRRTDPDGGATTEGCGSSWLGSCGTFARTVAAVAERCALSWRPFYSSCSSSLSCSFVGPSSVSSSSNDRRATFLRPARKSYRHMKNNRESVCIGVAGWLKRPRLPKYLEYLVVLCLERRYFKQNTIACFKSKYLSPSKNFRLATLLSGQL